MRNDLQGLDFLIFQRAGLPKTTRGNFSVALAGSFFLAAALILAAPVNVQAEVVRCEVSQKTPRLKPEWIEYAVSGRGTQADARDATGVAYGMDWSSAKVQSRTPARLMLQSRLGPITNDSGWLAAGCVEMRLSQFANGRFRAIVSPSRPKSRYQKYFSSGRRK